MRTFAKSVAHIGSTSSTLAVLIRVKSLSDLKFWSASSSTKQWSVPTVIPTSSSARMRAAYETACSERDIASLCISGWIWTWWYTVEAIRSYQIDFSVSTLRLGVYRFYLSALALCCWSCQFSTTLECRPVLRIADVYLTLLVLNIPYSILLHVLHSQCFMTVRLNPTWPTPLQFKLLWTRKNNPYSIVCSTFEINCRC